MSCLMCSLLGLVACEGEIGLGNPEDQLPVSGGAGDQGGVLEDGGTLQTVCDESAIEAGRAPLQRLRVIEYDNAIRDLLNDDSRPASRFVDDERGAISADARTLDTLLVEQYQKAAEDVAARATGAERFSQSTGCALEELNMPECIETFIEKFLYRLFRKPLSSTRKSAFVELYELGFQDDGVRTGAKLVIEAALQSPDFLYRPETESVATRDGAGFALDAFEVATRLAFFLWQSTPDDTLLSAAAAGELDTKEGVIRHARRMLAERDKSMPLYIDFVERLMGVEHLNELDKDRTLFPWWSDDTPQALRAELHAFVGEVIDNHGASWVTLMTAPWSMMNDRVRQHYGFDTGDESTFTMTERDPEHYAGLLTMGVVMSEHARSYETSPIHRGMFVRGNLLCESIPDVPEGLDTTPPPPSENQTTR